MTKNYDTTAGWKLKKLLLWQKLKKVVDKYFVEKLKEKMLTE